MRQPWILARSILDDFEPSDGLDGLLGMNVLRNYRFEIDQDKEFLYLSPRLGTANLTGRN
jgi:hypothetical protein